MYIQLKNYKKYTPNVKIQTYFIIFPLQKTLFHFSTFCFLQVHNFMHKNDHFWVLMLLECVIDNLFIFLAYANSKQNDAETTSSMVKWIVLDQDLILKGVSHGRRSQVK